MGNSDPDDGVTECRWVPSGSRLHAASDVICLKIWDAVGGTLKGVFKGITEADITAVCLDDR